MQNSSKHNDGPAVGSEKVATFADCLAALASDLREADVVSQEIQQLSAALSSHVSQLSADPTDTDRSAPAKAMSFAKSMVGRAAAVVATLVIGTGGLGVAGALPAPLQDAFDATVHAIGATLTGRDAGSGPASSTSQASSSARPTGRASVARGPVSSESQVTTPTPDLDDSQSEGDPSVGDEHRPPTATNVAAVIGRYDRETSEVSLGKLVSAVASEGKAGGTASVKPGSVKPVGKVAAPGQQKKFVSASGVPSEVPSATEQLP